ncbi:MAG TPA: hypothetical protein PLP19_03095 [bacterium]|nr:hypothetical protein [bacterium]HPN42454.1 hypothetical protein [bacterium]
MKKFLLLYIMFLCGPLYSRPIQLHPENPHYLLYKDKPAILITSGEHYGSVINLDFDYVKYLQTLAQDGLNYTRIFTGAYLERVGSFGIEKNTLAPKANRALVPWARSATPGYINGGNKFDLTQWDTAYFQRLKDFISQAEKYDIIVEVTLFSSIYTNDYWVYSPLYHGNNINATDSVAHQQAQTPANGNLMSFQEAMVRKLVEELNGFDNVFYEIQNEPWSDQTVQALILNPYDLDTGVNWNKRTHLATPASLQWQERIAAVITETEAGLENKHLIAQNFCNYKYPVDNVTPAVSIINFHYAWPEAVYWNYGYDRVISFDESGFSGNSDDVYRRQAWNFILAGGGIFNNLDYSFYPGCEYGSGVNNAPGGGNAVFRAQLKILREFIADFNFIAMKPDFEVIVLSPGVVSRALSEPGRQYAIYLDGGAHCNVTLNLPSGSFQAEWLDTKTGRVTGVEQLEHKGGRITLKSPEYEQDIALRILAR